MISRVSCSALSATPIRNSQWNPYFDRFRRMRRRDIRRGCCCLRLCGIDAGDIRWRDIRWLHTWPRLCRSRKVLSRHRPGLLRDRSFARSLGGPTLLIDAQHVGVSPTILMHHTLILQLGCADNALCSCLCISKVWPGCLMDLDVAEFPEVLWRYALAPCFRFGQRTHLVAFHAQRSDTTFQLYLFCCHLHDLLAF